MVCYMYYTDVFVGQNDNINNLKDALEAELKESGLKTDDLTQLVHGLCLFMGYPSCVCSLKVNLDESLKDISEKLIQDFEAVQSSHSSLNLDLNCSCIPKDILCKCCVIRCIKAVKKCDCIKNPSTECKCKGTKEKCCKDFLSGLEACLSLLNLKTDLEGCTCNGGDCCESGKCINSSCTLCSPQKFPDNAMTGLGICPMNPRKLAEKLEGYFKPNTVGSQDCSCQCGTSNKSCCCLACKDQDCSSQKSCFCSTPQCSCASKLQLPKECPCKAFCLAINDFKIAAQSTERTCCDSGHKCHCEVDGSGSNCSGQKCCIEQDSKGNFKHSVKCMIRRLVSYFKSLKSDTSNKGCFKNCCELMCVLKTCEFLKGFLTKGKCKTCTSGNSACSTGTCCKGDSSKCASNPNCCVGCNDCSALKFRNAFNDLRFAGPCGQDLWRTLDSFLNFIRYVFYAKVKDLKLEDKIKTARNKCGTCQKSGKHSSCNGCKSGTSGCSGCTAVLEELKDHKDVLSLMTRGYSSAYSSEASWPSLPSSLSGSNLKCCSNSSCPKCPSSCSSSGSSCPSNCCDACPQRKAAKIFLGMLPCLYYGLKIVSERCKYGSDFPDWHLRKITEAPELFKFLQAWGFSSSHLSSKNASGLPPILDSLFGTDKIFNALYEKSQNYFTSFSHSISSGSQDPLTVREMLLWLYGLRFQKHFSELVEICKSLCLPFGNSFHPDAFCYYIHASCFLAPIAIISLIEDSSSTATLLSSSSDWTSFSYPEDLSSLFDKLCEYARKIFVALNFLYFQCSRVGSQAGWAYCWYGKSCKVDSLPSGSVSSSSSGSGCSCKYSGAYLCTAINKDKVHDHCNGNSSTQKSCLGFGSTSTSCSVHNVPPPKPGSTPKCTPCPHPLQRFLTATSDSESYPFDLPDIVPMGFSKENLPKKARWGQDLYYVLKAFCQDGFCPLTRLVQFILCISQRPPETLLGLYAFFKKFVESDVFKDFGDYVDGEPGSYPGRNFAATVRAFYGAKDSHWKNGDQKKGHKNSDKTPADLQSLYNCHPKKDSDATCGAYLHPLTDNVAGVFTPELCGMYLSWICYRAKDFKTMFKDFHQKASEKFSSCCKSSCKKIVECPCALPFIYSLGFTLNSPKTLNCVDNEGKSKHPKDHSDGQEGKCTTKSCADFVAQLEKVADGQPFKDLLKVIDNFLWHIREPFFLFVLAFWAFVISYFLYVQLYKLDLLHLKSHAHFSRSFKILPSTLFSDASSKLKDLSYFTL
ncbi:variant erythrocyte surface antigen-1 family protein [Babesia divergens]|uniref:Variant erythrocyte surface antigen-1 family protein n=1 Tax=Babesia divergens TaxID=32595 RepID=A0AAD9GBC9_BABDI|nr:variant erythrocyte surface antigen-1 family protein [Babesia divergens]